MRPQDTIFNGPLSYLIFLITMYSSSIRFTQNEIINLVRQRSFVQASMQPDHLESLRNIFVTLLYLRTEAGIIYLLQHVITISVHTRFVLNCTTKTYM